MELEVKDLGQYEVEKILKRRKKGSGFQYFVKWKNFPMNQSTWEPEQHVAHLFEDLDQFEVDSCKKKKKHYNKNAKTMKKHNKAEIRRRNQQKISSYLMDKEEIESISDDFEENDSSFKLKEQEVGPEPIIQSREPYVIDIATEERGGKIFKIFTGEQVLNLGQRQATLLFPRQVCLFYSKITKILLKSKTPIE